MGRKLVGNNGLDKIYTPDMLSKAIVEYINPIGVVIEPCSGEGSFIRAIKEHGNMIEWCEIDKGRDYFKLEKSDADWLITNPPYSIFSKFLEKSMQLEIPKLAFLVTINTIWMNGKLNMLKKYGYQLTKIAMVESPYFRKLNDWKQSGFSLGLLFFIKKEIECFPISRNLKIDEILW